MTESKSSSSLTEECPPSHRKWVVIGTCASATTAIVALLWPFISPALRKVCLPYVPATPAQVSNVLTGLSNRPLPSRLLDIGSGDGRIVMATAGAGFQSTGVEINPWLVLYSRLSARRSLPRPGGIRQKNVQQKYPKKCEIKLPDPYGGPYEDSYLRS